MYNMEEKLYTEQDLEQYGQQIRQEMLNEFYTAVWQTPFRTAQQKATAYKMVEKIANRYGFSLEKKKILENTLNLLLETVATSSVPIKILFPLIVYE